MRRKSRIITFTVLLFFILDSSYFMASAETSNEIIFKDKNLQRALSKYYDWNETFTKEIASELSKNEKNLILDSVDIFDLEGLQYFENLTQVDLSGNKICNLRVLPKLKNLVQIVICYNAIKGKKFEDILYGMGNINRLNTVLLTNNGMYNINFLSKIGNIKNYTEINMEDNKIRNISLLGNASSLYSLDLSNNLITDVSPLKDLENLTGYLDLRDNCIIDYKPIKHLLDEMYSDPGNETGLERYDYYTDPVNIEYNEKTINFPYLTAYYKYQPYAEAIPLLEAIGGSAVYIKHMGILVCRYKGNVLAMADFSDRYILNGEVKVMEYPMRRMQYNLAYVPVKDICEALGLNYKVTSERKLYYHDDYYEYAPELVEISMNCSTCK